MPKTQPSPQQLVITQTNGVLYNYRMPKGLYRDLTSQATYHHTTLKQEIHNRLQRTLSSEYNYGANEKLLTSVQKLCTQPYNPDEWRHFDLDIPGYMLDTIRTLRDNHCFAPLDPELLNWEMNARLMYTMYDPFYNTSL